MALASSLNTWVQSVRLTDFQLKCTLTQSSTTKVPDFPSSLRGLEFLHGFTGSVWCKGSTEYLSLLHVIGHQPPCPTGQQAHPLLFMSFRNPFLLFCLKVEELSHSKWVLWLLRPCALCQTHNAVLTLSGAIKRRLSLHRGAVQESKLIFPAYALRSGRQHTEMTSVMFCSLKYLYLCVFLLLSQISV